MTDNPDARWFDERPRRIEDCPRCSGHGTVDIEYALAPTRHVIGSPNDAIRARVRGSFDIHTACREASDIARLAHQQVAFEFNVRGGR